MKTLWPSFAICSLVAASTVIAGAQQETMNQPRMSGATGALSATGTVVGPTLKPEPGVPVAVTGTGGKTFAVTDQNGRWSVYNLPAGEYNVQALDAHKAGESSASFTVKEKGVLQRWLSGEQPAIEMPQIRVNKESSFK